VGSGRTTYAWRGVRPDGVHARAADGRVLSALRTSTSALSIATAADAMRRGVVTCDPDSRLAAVAATMASNAFHAAVILAPDNPRALVVTDLDLIRAALSSGGEQIAAQIASEPMATIAPSARLEDAVALMAKRDLAHVLVADPAADWPAGVLSSFDIASMLAGRDPALTRMIRPGPARPLVSATALSATTVGDVMHPGVVACSAETPVLEVARMMADLRMHCIAVVGVARRHDGDEHLLWGLVSDMDVLHAAHRAPRRADDAGVGGGRDCAPCPPRVRRPRPRRRDHDRARRHARRRGRALRPALGRRLDA
jgi:CBS domain-containing protein